MAKAAATHTDAVEHHHHCMRMGVFAYGEWLWGSCWTGQARFGSRWQGLSCYCGQGSGCALPFRQPVTTFRT